MKKVLLMTAGLLLSAPVLSAQYQVNYGWTDTTVYLPSETKDYESKYRIAGGTETTITSLTVPGGSMAVTADPGQAIEMSFRNCSMTPSPLCGPWLPWITATAPFPQTTPNVPTGASITVIYTGP
jgi:hypothetical protein